MKKLVAAIFALGATGGAAIAQDTPALEATPPDFATVDTDGNSEVSFEEALAVWPAITAEQFAAIDADVSGSLSSDEFLALLETISPAP